MLKEQTVVLSVSNKISDITKQIAPPLLSMKMRIMHVKMATALQAYAKEEVHYDI